MLYDRDGKVSLENQQVTLHTGTSSTLKVCLYWKVLL